MNKPGILYVVATPIGNLADITLRALDILKSVDLIAAEDTRHSLVLLNHYGITRPIISLHQHNEQQKISELLSQLQAGLRIALISDAGTPLISDPGSRLVQALHQENMAVIPIPGPCAAISALSVSGLPTDRFVFEGFLPSKSVARRQRLQALANETRTLVFYEAPHRIEDLLKDLIDLYGGERLATYVREMTKNFETIRHTNLNNLYEIIGEDPNQRKGEFVLMVHGADEIHHGEQDEIELQRVLNILLEELPLKQAVTLAVKLTRVKKNDIYALALQTKRNEA